jgi:hypothetical protein
MVHVRGQKFEIYDPFSLVEKQQFTTVGTTLF